MKSLILFIIFIPVFGFTQAVQIDGKHWVSFGSISSPSLRINFEGYISGGYHIAVTNKQPCTVRMQLYGYTISDTTITILAEKTKHIIFLKPFAADTIWCKALDSCSATYDTCFWGVTTAGALAVKPTVHGIRLPDGSIRVTVQGQHSGTLRYKKIGAATWSEMKLTDNTIIIKP